MCEVIWGSLQRIVVLILALEINLLYSLPLSLQINGLNLCQPLLHLASMSPPSDQRWYGRTTGWDTSSFESVNLRALAPTNLVHDVIVLVRVQRLGYHRVKCIVGHDFGCVPASLAALSRPDILRNIVLLGHPFLGAPKLPFDAAPNEEELPAKLECVSKAETARSATEML